MSVLHRGSVAQSVRVLATWHGKPEALGSSPGLVTRFFTQSCYSLGAHPPMHETMISAANTARISGKRGSSVAGVTRGTGNWWKMSVRYLGSVAQSVRELAQ